MLGVRLLATAAGIAAILGVSAIWAMAGIALGDPSSWFALIAALDAALLLRLASYPAGRERAAVALAITAMTVLGAGFLFAATRVGLLMGMPPAESIWKMSTSLAYLFVQANTGWTDALWIAAALILAWRAGR